MKMEKLTPSMGTSAFVKTVKNDFRKQLLSELTAKSTENKGETGKTCTTHISNMDTLDMSKAKIDQLKKEEMGGLLTGLLTIGCGLSMEKSKEIVEELWYWIITNFQSKEAND